MNGYAGGDYARSLTEFGRPRPLERSGGWVLDRVIPGRADRDAMGPYPLFACRDWAALKGDLADLTGLVSLVLVADPFGDFDPSDLATTFNRGAIAFKRHHVVELGRPVEQVASPHHRRNARKALGGVDVARLDAPEQWLDDWIKLYGVLTRRHQIGGVAAFSRVAFARLFAIPGLVVFRAEAGGATVGMLLWVVRGNVAYYHLGAYDEAGYRLNASFALFWRAIEWFRAAGLVRWLDLGAGAGIGPTGLGDGLDRFKAGWATGTRTAYLCRHVFQGDRYDQLVAASGAVGANFFPAYRAGEFAASSPPTPAA